MYMNYDKFQCFDKSEDVNITRWLGWTCNREQEDDAPSFACNMRMQGSGRQRVKMGLLVAIAGTIIHSRRPPMSFEFSKVHYNLS